MNRPSSNNVASVADFQDGVSLQSKPFFFSQLLRGDKDSLHQEKSMNGVRQFLGLYKNYVLADDMLAGSSKREKAFKKSGAKQLNHARGTDGWFRSMLVLEARAIDNFFYSWLVVVLNALLAAILNKVTGLEMSHDLIQQWDMVYSLVLKTSLAFLLVFRLNRCAMRFWDARGHWGSITHITRNLVGGIIMYCGHSPRHRDMAIRWASAFCVATMHFIRNEPDYSFDELAGILSTDQIKRMKDANHSALFAASMCRYHLRRAFKIDSSTPAQLAHAYSVQMISLEQQVARLVEQVSGMEKIRSTPLPIAYVSHLRTFLFAYLIFLPYIWVSDWGWTAVPLVAFTAFALFGIEGASTEVEIPFDRSRPNHLALDAYCMVILDSVQGLVVHDANMHMQEQQDGEDGNDPEIGETPAIRT